MKVSSFYQPCQENALYNALSGANQNIVLSNGIKMMCESMLKGRNHNSILKTLEEYLMNNYQSYWFSYSWQKEQCVKDDVQKVARFLKWLGNVQILAANVPVSVAHPNGTDILEDEVSLVAKYGNDAFGAIRIHLGKNKFSLNGKTVHTQSKNNLHALVTKSALEERFPGIIITSVFLTNEEDSLGHIAEAFTINNTKNSNITSVSFSDFYVGGKFNTDAMHQKIASVVNTPVKVSCYGCSNTSLCKMQKLNSGTEAQTYYSDESATSTYSVPNFTEEQLEVVNHVNGPMLVCAGPGSGKTATLVGRIKALMEKGIDADYILAITFTRDAARVLEQRISTFCNDMPTISTINALCYKILRDNKEYVGNVKLLERKEKYSILNGLIEAMPKALSGISYTKGENELVRAVEGRIDKYIKLNCDREAFMKLYPELSSDFCDMAEYYIDIIKTNGFISFQEQISLCVSFLENHPDALEDYRRIYRYIMVDEFQDIDAMQAKFIYMLATHENLVVVGDDDQAIYGFRGGSHRFMLDFQHMFPKARKVVFKENFRSTREIVDASQAVINENAERILKNITATRECGTAPVLRDGTDIDMIESTIYEVLKQGYSYGDIAILSQKNSTLESIKSELTVPAVLEKSLLVNEPLFASVYFSLLFLRSNKQDNRALLFLCKLFGVTFSKSSSKLLYESLLADSGLDANRLKVFLDNCVTWMNLNAAQYVQNIAFELSLENSHAILRLGEIMNEYDVHSVTELLELMDFMVRYEDDTKVDVTGSDAVLLITNHESKGREFPVVILVNDIQDVTEESRRVLYVAMTRAQDKLYVLSNETASSMLDAINQ